MIALGNDTLALFREHLKEVTSLNKTGSVSRYELLQAQVRFKEQKTIQLEIENRYRRAFNAFNCQLGFDETRYIRSQTKILLKPSRRSATLTS
jgi:outer membrane protein TolC